MGEEEAEREALPVGHPEREGVDVCVGEAVVVGVLLLPTPPAGPPAPAGLVEDDRE